MRAVLLLCALCMQLSWSYGFPGATNGVASFAYQDSAGNRYGGTYGLKDGEYVPLSANSYPVPFAEPAYQGYQGNQGYDEFFPAYFKNLENLLQEAFYNSFEHQKVAFNAARKAYDLTTNYAGYIPNFTSRFPSFGGFPGFGGLNMPGFNGPNSAFASAAASPGYNHHIAAINPINPDMPNVNVVNRFADTPSDNGQGKYYSVSSSSYSSSSNLNGQESNMRGAETVVNDNGRVTKYKVTS